ncbi:hypothetical protein GCM10023204_57200 [Actinomycetospora succinea]
MLGHGEPPWGILDGTHPEVAMSEDEPAALEENRAIRDSVHEHAVHLRRRIRSLAGEIAVSEDTLARVLEDAARLRPHAAGRLREAAHQARLYAEQERHVSEYGWPLEDPPTTTT